MKVDANLNVAREMLFHHNHEFEIVPEKKIPFEAFNPSTGEKFIVSRSLWKKGNTSLIGNNVFVDEIQNIVSDLPGWMPSQHFPGNASGLRQFLLTLLHCLHLGSGSPYSIALPQRLPAHKLQRAYGCYNG